MVAFQVGGPVTGEEFFDRKEILERLEREIVEKKKIGFAVYGQRRIGKTSLLKEFARKIRNEKVVPVYIDATRVYPPGNEGVYDAIVMSVVKACKTKKLAESVKEVLKGSFGKAAELLRNVEVEVSIKDYVTLKVKRLEQKEAEKKQSLLLHTFELVEELAKSSGKRVILILDEFQLLEQEQEGTLWAIRSIVQNWKCVALVISGSEVSFMEQAVALKTAPFYMLFPVEKLGPFDEKQSTEMMRKKFDKIGVEYDSPTLKKTFELVGGVPFYFQWLGDKIYDLQVKKAREKTVLDAFDKMLGEADVLFSAELQKVSNGEKAVIVEMACGEKKVAAVANKTGKDLQSTAKLFERLELKGFAKKIGPGEYDFEDNVLEAWLKKKYGEQK